MHEAALASAALPPPTVVLGLLLQPYSLGHELFLIREGNPLAFALRPIGHLATRSQLAQSVLICCQGWDANRNQWRDRLSGLKLRLWRWRVRKSDLAGEVAAFLDYQANGCLEFPPSPAVTDTKMETPARAAGTPFILRIHQFLTIRLGLSQSQAWDYPYGLGVMQWEAWHESGGTMHILNAEEAEHLAFVERMEKEEKEKTCLV